MHGTNLIGILYAIKDVCSVSKHIFEVLICGIGQPGKGAKCSHIAEIGILKSPDIKTAEPAKGYVVYSFGYICGKAVKYRKIIGAAAGNVPDRYLDIISGNAGECFIKGTVTTSAADQIIIAGQRCSQFYCFAAAGSDAACYQISAVHQSADNVGNIFQYLLLT